MRYRKRKSIKFRSVILTPKEIGHGGNNEMTSCSEHTGGSSGIMESQKYCPRPRWIITFLTRKWTVWRDNSKVEMDWKLIWKFVVMELTSRKELATASGTRAQGGIQGEQGNLSFQRCIGPQERGDPELKAFMNHKALTLQQSGCLSKQHSG